MLRYVGRVKGWVARKSEAGLVAALSERETDAWPLPGRAPAVKGARWVRPELTVTVTALPREETSPCATPPFATGAPATCSSCCGESVFENDLAAVIS